MLYNISKQKSVSVACATANFSSLLKEAETGTIIIISPYRKPVAIFAPATPAGKEVRLFGTGNGRVRIIDPNWADPMTDEEVGAFMEGRN